MRRPQGPKDYLVKQVTKPRNVAIDQYEQYLDQE